MVYLILVIKLSNKRFDNQKTFFEQLLGRLKALAQNIGDTSRIIHAEKFNLHLSSSWFKIRVGLFHP